MNFYDLCKKYNVEVRQHGEHHHCTEGWNQVDCPSCSPQSGNFRLGWNLSGNYFNCWSCGKLNTLKTLSILTRQSIAKLKALLEGMEFDKSYEQQQPPGVLKIPAKLRELLLTHRTYLNARGFDDLDKLESLWKIQAFDWKNPQYAWRIFLPIVVGGEVISWTTRAIVDKTKYRYMAAPVADEKFPAKEVLYGIDYCHHSIVICEGPLDVWKIGPGAVATMGTGYTKAQMLMASRFLNKYICFDAEPKAQKRAMRLCRDLMLFPGITQNILLDSGKDPGNCSDEELQYLKGLLL